MNSLNTLIKNSILFYGLLIKSTLTSLYLKVVLITSLYLNVLSKASANLICNEPSFINPIDYM